MRVLVTVIQVQVSKLHNYQQFREVVLRAWSPDHCIKKVVDAPTLGFHPRPTGPETLGVGLSCQF